MKTVNAHFACITPDLVRQAIGDQDGISYALLSPEQLMAWENVGIMVTGVVESALPPEMQNDFGKLVCEKFIAGKPIRCRTYVKESFVIFCMADGSEVSQIINLAIPVNASAE